MSRTPVTPTPEAATETVEERFRRLAAVWRTDTAYLSSMDEAESHPAYREIIQLGPPVVPLLLRDLPANHTHWFGALEAITGVQPVPASAGGDIPAMTQCWLRWAKRPQPSMVNPLEVLFPSVAGSAYQVTSPAAATTTASRGRPAPPTKMVVAEQQPSERILARRRPGD